MAELLGTHSYQLDPKGRVSLPSRFREVFADGAVLTLGQDGCLFCFPRAEWDRRSGELRDLPLSDAQARAYSRMFFGSTEHASPDTQGRLTISPRLRGQLSFGREVVVMGVFDHLEIWDAAAWDHYEQQNAMAYRSGALELGEV